MHLHTPLPDLLHEDRTDFRRDARTYSRAMLLKGAVKSSAASRLVSAMIDDVVIPYRRSQGQLRPSMLPHYHAITVAFLADLLGAAGDGRWSKLSTDSGHLASVPGGRSAFGVLRGAMGAAGYLEELPGYYRHYEMFGVGQQKASRTCFRPTPRLLALAAGHGIDPSETKRHFAAPQAGPPAAVEALGLVAAKEKASDRAKRVEIPEGCPKAAEIVSGIERLNRHLLDGDRIGGIAFSGLRRSFSNADLPDFAYQWHGRYYSMPEADGYERMEGGNATRERLITIDGHPCREIDVSASQLTILHGLLGVPFDPEGDPYALDGLPRDRVKEWLMFVLGSSGTVHGGNRLKKEKLAGLARYPFLGELQRHRIGPLDLQYHEAEIMRLAMEDLMDAQGIGFLPVHDALMVSVGNEELARSAIRQAFKRYFKETLGMPMAPVPIV